HRQPEMWVSLDGTQFVSVSALGRARQQGKPQVVSRKQDIVEVKPYQMFLQLSELEETQHAFPDPADSPRRIRIFISYAHIDENPYKERLKVTIKNLARRFPIDVWDDRQLFAGHQWEPEILQKLDQADIVCLLISPDFIASDYCFSKEMEKALAKYEQGRGIPIPILIRATSDWEQFPIGRHQALPTPAKPLAQWQDPDEFWASVQLGLRQQIERHLDSLSADLNIREEFQAQWSNRKVSE
ncbi:MAG: toll/interleukin-1 receptor domain-containing protein, partial [Nitrospirota bacterium]